MVTALEAKGQDSFTVPKNLLESFYAPLPSRTLLGVDFIDAVPHRGSRYEPCGA